MRTLLVAIAVLFLALLGVTQVLPTYMDNRMNSVERAAPYPASARAHDLHKRLFVADMHDDALLWSRDLLMRHSYGHSDLPRLQRAAGSSNVEEVAARPDGLLGLKPQLTRADLRPFDIGRPEPLRRHHREQVLRSQARLVPMFPNGGQAKRSSGMQRQRQCRAQDLATTLAMRTIQDDRVRSAHRPSPAWLLPLPPASAASSA